MPGKKVSTQFPKNTVFTCKCRIAVILVDLSSLHLPCLVFVSLTASGTAVWMFMQVGNLYQQGTMLENCNFSPMRAKR